jgi:two-component system NtrC family sensor kinase
MSGGGVLELSVDLDGDWVVTRLHDTGSGISAENMKKIFDPFFTTKGSSGTGLGLAISYGIIHSHGGTIEVESTVGEGTTFTIQLPVGGVQAAGSPPVEAAASAAD